MDRRHFLRRTAAAASVAALSSRAYAAAQSKPRRVGLIGCGWYGKCDLLQLINIEPVEVVSLCDVDSRMLSEAADLHHGEHGNEARSQLGIRSRHTHRGR
jgi:predicted homoserine dehydrogenase-like protein